MYCFVFPIGTNYCTRHNCSHDCLLSNNSSSLNYSCVCPDGFRLGLDGITCMPIDHYQMPIHPSCKLDKTFQCTNKICIHNSLVCDGRNDCGDNSDEVNNCSKQYHNTDMASLHSTSLFQRTPSVRRGHFFVLVIKRSVQIIL